MCELFSTGSLLSFIFVFINVGTLQKYELRWMKESRVSSAFYVMSTYTSSAKQINSEGEAEQKKVGCETTNEKQARGVSKKADVGDQAFNMEVTISLTLGELDSCYHSLSQDIITPRTQQDGPLFKVGHKRSAVIKGGVIPVFMFQFIVLCFICVQPSCFYG